MKKMVNFRYVVMAIALLVFWLLLVAWDLQSLMIGLFFIALALYTSYCLAGGTVYADGAPRIQVLRLPHFLLFFLANSIKGGIATAKLAFSPNLALSLSPSFVYYPIKHIKPGAPMHLFINLISLLPGSVCVIREPNGVLVHVLRSDPQITEELRDCELAVGNLFAIGAQDTVGTE